MKWKMLLVALAAAILVGAGVGYFAVHHSAKAAETGCLAGPGEICPSPDFLLELKTLKWLGERQRTLSQDPKVKELVQLMDTQRGMAERMQQEINQTLQANPGHLWDGQKEKFILAPIPALPPSQSGTKK